MVAVPVVVPQTLHFTYEQFEQLAAANPELRLELTAVGEIIVMAPTGSEGGNYNAELLIDIGTWNRQTRLGKVFDSSSGFTLPNGAVRSPDTAWVAQARWNQLTPTQQKTFAPICPDFVLELLSETDNLKTVQTKMQEYIDNGCQLGWLIAPKTQQVEIYRIGQPVELLQSPQILSGEVVLPGFRLSLQQIWG